jgi:hypothetical protein
LEVKDVGMKYRLINKYYSSYFDEYGIIDETNDRYVYKICFVSGSNTSFYRMGTNHRYELIGCVNKIIELDENNIDESIERFLKLAILCE